MATFTVLGAGMMGSAFCIPLHDRGHTVHLVGTHLDRDIIDGVRRSRLHPTLEVLIPDGVQAHQLEELAPAVEASDWIVLGVNSLGVAWAAGQLRPLLTDGAGIIFLTKGLAVAGDAIQILPETFRSLLPAELGPSLRIFAIGGPSIAGELARRRPTSVVLAAEQAQGLDELAQELRTPYYVIHPSSDLLGVEWCVALKNLYSVGVGMAQAEGTPAGEVRTAPLVHNPSAAMFAQALAEMLYLCGAHSGEPGTTLWLAGAGDLYVTCQGGRNSRFGRYLQQGNPLGLVRASLMEGETIEGYEVAAAIGSALRQQLETGSLDRARLPLLQFLLDVLLDGAQAEIPWSQFRA